MQKSVLIALLGAAAAKHDSLNWSSGTSCKVNSEEEFIVNEKGYGQTNDCEKFCMDAVKELKITETVCCTFDSHQ